MATDVCMAASALHYSEGGGYLWAYLNWALGLRSAGCRVTWLEATHQADRTALEESIRRLRRRLAPYGFGDALVVHAPDGVLDAASVAGVEAALSGDLLVDLAYTSGALVRRFRRAALVDIDPGLTQAWIGAGELERPPHDVCFTIGEAVGTSAARFPDCGLAWHYTPPCVALEAWPAQPPAAREAPYTTVAHWWEADAGLELEGQWIDNSKRASFARILDLPARSRGGFELALGGLDDDEERHRLERHGWGVRAAEDVAGTPAAYQEYVRWSRGELSCAKPGYTLLRTGWLSDRTVCYLASGRPAIVENTGSTRLRGLDGLRFFEDVREASEAIEEVERDYPRHCRAARALAEEHFDARKVAIGLLERALA